MGTRRGAPPVEAKRPGPPGGFTLVETLVAVLVLSLVAGVVVAVILPAGAGTRSRIDRAHAERAGASLVEELLATDFALVLPGTFGPSPLPGQGSATAELSVVAVTPRLKSLTVTVRLGDEEATLTCLKGIHSP